MEAMSHYAPWPAFWTESLAPGKIDLSRPARSVKVTDCSEEVEDDGTIIRWERERFTNELPLLFASRKDRHPALNLSNRSNLPNVMPADSLACASCAHEKEQQNDAGYAATP
jgi:hypothetical protein